MAGKTCIGQIDRCITARVYTKPSILSDLAGMVSRGEEVLVENYDPDRHFCKVITNTGVEGYCFAPFVKIKEEELSNE